MDELKVIKSEPSPPDTKSWYEYSWKAQQQTPNRIEDAAKFLATMISLSLSIFAALGKSMFESANVPGPIKISLIFWLAALLVSFLVLFPWRYSYSGDSIKTFKVVHKKLVWIKYGLLALALLLFLAALIIMTLTFFF